MKINDFKGYFKKNQIKFIEKIKESEDIYTFVFEKPMGLEWKSGQHGIFKINGVKGKKWRAFSIVSNPSEEVIKIATRIGENPSSFKKALLNLSKGDTVNLNGPFGWMYYNREDESLFIAGGIGITPFVPLSKEVKKGKLIYIDKGENYVYREVIKENGVEVESRSELNKEILQEVFKYKVIYISGPLSFIKYIKKEIKSNGIKNTKIIIDPFLGY